MYEAKSSHSEFDCSFIIDSKDKAADNADASDPFACPPDLSLQARPPKKRGRPAVDNPAMARGVAVPQEYWEYVAGFDGESWGEKLVNLVDYARLFAPKGAVGRESAGRERTLAAR